MPAFLLKIIASKSPFIRYIYYFKKQTNLFFVKKNNLFFFWSLNQSVQKSRLGWQKKKNIGCVCVGPKKEHTGIIPFGLKLLLGFSFFWACLMYHFLCIVWAFCLKLFSEYPIFFSLSMMGLKFVTNNNGKTIQVV